MTKALYRHKGDIKAAILAGETYAAVAERYATSTQVVHALLSKDPDVVAAKASGALRSRGKPKMTLEECLADPVVVDVIHNNMTTVAAAKKYGVSQPAVWAKVKKAKDLMSPPPPSPTTPFTNREPPPPPTPPTQDPELQAISTLITAYALRHNLTTASVLDNLASLLQSGTR